MHRTVKCFQILLLSYCWYKNFTSSNFSLLRICHRQERYYRIYCLSDCITLNIYFFKRLNANLQFWVQKKHRKSVRWTMQTTDFCSKNLLWIHQLFSRRESGIKLVVTETVEWRRLQKTVWITKLFWNMCFSCLTFSYCLNANKTS